VLRSDLTTSLIAQGVPSAQAHRVASSALSQGRGSTSVIPQFVRADFADAIHVVLWGMAAAMAVAAVVALVGLRRGVHVGRSAAAWELRGRDNESGLVPALRPEFSATELRHFETAPRPRSLVVLLRAHGTPCVRRRSTVRARGVGARW